MQERGEGEIRKEKRSTCKRKMRGRLRKRKDGVWNGEDQKRTGS